MHIHIRTYVRYLAIRPSIHTRTHMKCKTCITYCTHVQHTFAYILTHLFSHTHVHIHANKYIKIAHTYAIRCSEQEAHNAPIEKKGQEEEEKKKKKLKREKKKREKLHCGRD